MPKVLWVGDAGCPTGFAQVTHSILEHLQQLGWEVAVLGINAKGNPHNYPYRIYSAVTVGDVFGFSRLQEVLDEERSDVVLICSDVWITATFLANARDIEPEKRPAFVGYMPIEGPDITPDQAKTFTALEMPVFWTKFGAIEAGRAGYQGGVAVIPLGLDTNVFYPINRGEAREMVGWDIPPRAWVIGNVNRNQPRKRFDATMDVFVRWTRRYGREAYLYLHCDKADPPGWDLPHLARHYGIPADRLLLPDFNVWKGIQKEKMRAIYSALDVQMSTTSGEGWGLTTMEGMACGIPQVVPKWSALAEWPGDAVIHVPVREHFAFSGRNTTCFGGLVDPDAMAAELERLYTDPAHYRDYSTRGFDHVRDERFTWPVIAKQFDVLLRGAIEARARHAEEDRAA